jgi:hypothetical protein
MSIDFSSETLLSFSEATRSLPGRPHISTLHRWRLRGVRGVKLKTVLVGGRRYVSLDALDRFNAAVTAAADGETPPARTPRRRAAEIQQAELELDREGI